MNMKVDFSRVIRPIGKLNGTNNGPLGIYSDRSCEFRDLGVEFIRFHDTHLATAKCVDMPFIFRVFDADENDPANYYFDETDALIKSALDVGAEIMYRLGPSIEGTTPKIFCVVPKDYDKWARIAEHIIMHYNEGWANGFHYNIEYFEIWNEADLIPFWSTGMMNYIDFYVETANHIKKRCPKIKIGPCGFAGVYRPVRPDPDINPAKAKDYDQRVIFFDTFLERIAKGDAPMDFFPWHKYAIDSLTVEQSCEVMAKLLAKHSLSHVELINTEWNGISLTRDSAGYWDFSQMFTGKHAIIVIADMIVMQKYGNTKAAYYLAEEGSSFCGLYNYDGTLGPHYYSLKSWKYLRACENEVYTEGDTAKLRICGASNGKRAAVLITNESDNDEKITLKLDGIPSCDYTVTVYDSENKLVPVKKGRFGGRALSFTMGKESARLIEFDISEV